MLVGKRSLASSRSTGSLIMVPLGTTLYPEGAFPNLNLRRVAAARFYIGAVSLDTGDIEGYREQLALAEQLTATERTAVSDHEYHLTRYELRSVRYECFSGKRG